MSEVTTVLGLLIVYFGDAEVFAGALKMRTFLSGEDRIEDKNAWKVGNPEEVCNSSKHSSFRRLFIGELLQADTNAKRPKSECFRKFHG